MEFRHRLENTKGTKWNSEFYKIKILLWKVTFSLILKAYPSQKTWAIKMKELFIFLLITCGKNYASGIPSQKGIECWKNLICPKWFEKIRSKVVHNIKYNYDLEMKLFYLFT